jgi:hypothetical protein
MPGGKNQVLVRIDLPYMTHLNVLRDALDLARQRGLQSVKIPGGRALTAANLFAGPLAQDEASSAARFADAFASVRRRAGISDANDIVLRSVDLVGRSAVTPPWAIYPLAPAMCASLIADVAIFYVAMNANSVLDALERQGLTARWVQPLDEMIDRSRSLLEVDHLTRLPSGGAYVRRLGMNLSEMNRLVLELVDLDTWAQHVAIVLQCTDLGETPPWPYFAKEREVWA